MEKYNHLPEFIILSLSGCIPPGPALGPSLWFGGGLPPGGPKLPCGGKGGILPPKGGPPPLGGNGGTPVDDSTLMINDMDRRTHHLGNRLGDPLLRGAACYRWEGKMEHHRVGAPSFLEAGKVQGGKADELQRNLVRSKLIIES